ncbi:MAG: hypothetical protein ACE5GA_00960 [Candidatus Zixiibacteriota bacterium]
MAPPKLWGLKRLPVVVIGFAAAFFGTEGARAGVCAGCSVFVTDPDSAGVWLRDGDPREKSPTQKRGTLSTLRFGSEFLSSYHLALLDTIVVTGDTTDDGNGVPAGREIMACTLWLSVSSMHFEGTDDVVYDLYSIDEAWNEDDGNALSWSNRKNNVAWATAGVTGTLKTSALVKMVRQDANSYKWFTDVAGTLTLWDSIVVADGDSVPAPVHLDIARDMYAGNNYGLALKLNTSQSATAIQHTLGSSENATMRRRPQFQWVYSSPSGLAARRRIVEVAR